MAKKLLIGLAEEKITPDKSIELDGQFYERISEGVETDLYAHAIAIDNGETKAIIIEVDIVGIAENLISAIREKISDMKDFDPKDLIIGCTHVHTSFVYKRESICATKCSSTMSISEILDQFGSDVKYAPLTADKKPEMSDEEATEFLVEKISSLVRKVWSAREEASIKFGFGRAAIGMNRRSVFSDGRGYMWGDTNHPCFEELEAGNDSGIEMMFVFDKNNKLKGLMANVACPAQIMEHRSVISSDFWGKVRIMCREKFGDDFILIPSTAAGGDQCPRDMIRWVNGETPINDPNISRPNYIERRADPSMFDIKGTWKAGKRIFHEIEDTLAELDEIPQPEENIFRHETISLDLPLRRVTQKEYEDSTKAIKEFLSSAQGEIGFADKAALYIHAGNIQRYQLQQKIDMVNTEIHILRLGDVAFATNPFELFLDYGNKIRARSLAKQTFLLQLTQGCGHYLPTKAAEEHGHYSAYISSGFVGHEGGDILVRKTTEVINKMFAD